MVYYCLKPLQQLNESIADVLSVVQGSSSYQAAQEVFENSHYIKNNYPSKQFVNLCKSALQDYYSHTSYIKIKLNNGIFWQIPLTKRICYHNIPEYPTHTKRISLIKYFKNKYPNGIKSLDKNSIKKLRKEIISFHTPYNKICRYLLIGTTSYISYKTIRVLAENNILPFSKKLNNLFKKVDAKIGSAKECVKNLFI